MHDWEPYSGYHYVYGRHFKWGSRLIAKSFYKIFLSCLKFLFTLLALRILNHYLAFKQYQYWWSSGDEVFPPALTVPGAPGWGERGKYQLDQRPLLRKAGDGPCKFRNPIVQQWSCYYVNKIVRFPGLYKLCIWSELAVVCCSTNIIITSNKDK